MFHPGFVHEHEVRRLRAAQQRQRRRRSGIQHRALAFDPEHVFRRTVAHQFRFDRTARVIHTHRIQTHAGAANHHAGLARTNERRLHAARPRLAIKLQRRGHFADVHIGADKEHALAGQLPRRRRAGF
jgi:hypothetical protein